MKTPVLIFLLSAIPMALHAQTVIVRSGEHASFTRLVLNLPRSLEWSLAESGNVWRVDFDDNRINFDTTAVFDRIPRTRLQHISGNNGSLSLTIDCLCDVEAFLHNNTMLVLDIRDDLGQGSPADTDPNNKDVLELTVPAKLKEFSPSGTTRSVDLLAHHIPGALNISQIGAGITNAPKHEGSDIAGARERLLHQFARAATQGLLSPRASGLGSMQNSEPDAVPIENDDSDDDDEKLPEAAVEHEVPPEDSKPINLTAKTSIDDDFRESFPDFRGGAENPSCPKNDQVDVASWGGEASFSQELGKHRAALSGELGKTDEEELINLTKFYLYFGFGAEALQVLNTTHRSTLDHQILRELADILDNGKSSKRALLRNYLQCDTPAALWAAMAHEHLPSDATIQLDAIAFSFNELPKHLRRHLGPILSNRLLDKGYRDAGRKILNIVERSRTTVSPDSAIANISSANPSSKNEKPQAYLEEIVAENVEASPKALLRIIDLKLGSDDPISYEIAQLAGAYAQEFRGQPVGQEIIQAYLVSLAQSGAFLESFKEFDRLTGDLTETARRETRSSLFYALSRKAEDPVFLRFAYSDHLNDSDGVEPDVLNLVIRRLIDSGFYTYADRLSQTPVYGASTRTRALLRAEIQLKLSKPRQAEVHMLGITGKDVNILRAHARRMEGEFASAYQLYLAGEDHANAAQAAWQAEDWRTLRQMEGSTFSKLANRIMEINALSQAGADNETLDKGPLARDRELIETSELIRKKTNRLLEELPVPSGN